MLRRLQNITGKNIDTQCTAKVDMVRGMFVQKDKVNKNAIMPAAATNLFWVDRDVQPTGLMTYEGEISEYDDRIDKISAGDFVQLEKPMSGERYATDQFVATGLEDGGYVTVSIAADETLGKIIASETATEFVYNGTITENGHTLAIIEVL